MEHKLRILTIALATTLIAPLASAHPHATVIENDGTICYIATDGNATLLAAVNVRPSGAVPTYWIETNGLLDSGEARGPPETGAGVSGAPYWDVTGELAANVVGSEPGDFHESLEDGESGLQQGVTPGDDGILGTVDDVPADTQVDAATFAALCL